jgi:hypothetical protein
VYFDDGTGGVYNVPADVDYIERMPALIANIHRHPEITRSPEHASDRTPPAAAEAGRHQPMKIRIGQDDYGEPITANTTGPVRIALVGHPEAGKTTTCRYVARRWSAHRRGPCLAITSRGYEYRDLAAAGVLLVTDLAAAVAAHPGMLIVDEAEHLSGDAVRQTLRSPHAAVLITSFGAAPAAKDFAVQPPDAAPGLTASYAVRHHPQRQRGKAALTGRAAPYPCSSNAHASTGAATRPTSPNA